MPAMQTLGTTIRIVSRVIRAIVTGAVALSRLAWRGVAAARQRGAGGAARLARLFDLHAASCAGDTLALIGLAGAMFLEVSPSEATGRMALCIFLTLIPFAIFAPLVGPAVDRMIYGRRYALAGTMVGRALLAYLVSEQVGGFPALAGACGVFALSHIYGVTRSALIPRTAPEKLGLSLARARIAFFGMLAGVVLAPVGLIAVLFGFHWALRGATVVFLIGTIVAARSPLRADGDPPEPVPNPYRRLSGSSRSSGTREPRGAGLLVGRAMVSALLGSVSLRMLDGFLMTYLILAVRSDRLSDELLSWTLSRPVALCVVAGAFAGGSLIVILVGTVVRIRQAAVVQAVSTMAAMAAAGIAALRPGLLPVLLMCFATAVASGLAVFALDGVIEERIDERARVGAFSFADTLGKLAWLAGCALGLIPFSGRSGLAVAAGMALLAAIRSVLAAFIQRAERRARSQQHDAKANGARKHSAPPERRKQPVRAQRTEPPGQRLPDWVGSNDVGREPEDGSDEATLQAPRFHLYRPTGMGEQSPDQDGEGR